MTKRDYEAIAGIIRNTVPRSVPCTRISPHWQNSNDAYALVAEALAEYMAKDNPRFNREHFLSACRGVDYHQANGRTRRYSVAL